MAVLKTTIIGDRGWLVGSCKIYKKKENPKN